MAAVLVFDPCLLLAVGGAVAAAVVAVCSIFGRAFGVTQRIGLFGY